MPVVDLSRCEDGIAQARRLAFDDSRRSFDLSTGPLFRARLLRISREDHLLSLTFHHLCFDAWSQSVLLRELPAFYEAFTAGHLPEAFPLPIQYADYAVWERRDGREAGLQEGLSFWRAHLADPPVLALPTDFARRQDVAEEAGRVDVHLEPGLVRALRELALSEETTLFVTLLAAFGTLISRYSQQEDVIVGCPVAGRTRIETEGLIGLFINTLPLRLDLSGDPTFRLLLRRTRDLTWSALKHQDVPLQRIVHEAMRDRSPGRPPLFQTIFVFEHLPLEARVAAGVAFQPEDIDPHATRVDLSLELAESAQGIGGHVNFRSDLWSSQSIERMIGHLQTLLRAAVLNADCQIARLPLLTATERALVIGKWSSPKAFAIPTTTIHELFSAQAAMNPEAIAVVSADDGRELTYHELETKANRLAHRLQGIGVGVESRVGVLLDRSFDALIGILGVLKAGAAFVPLDPRTPPERLAALLADCHPSVLVTRQAWEAAGAAAGCVVVLLDGGADAGHSDRAADAASVGTSGTGPAASRMHSEPPASGATSHNLAYVLYTSGSTGVPAGVMVEHHSLVNFCLDVVRSYQLGSSDRVLQFSSLTFDACLEDIFPIWLAGGTLVLRTDDMLSTVRRFVENLHGLQITVTSLPTAYWHVMCESLSEEQLTLPPALRLVTIGGEQARKNHLLKWRQRVGDTVQLLNTYGPTETTVIATACDLTGTGGVDLSPEELPIGRPIANVQCYVLDGHNQPAPIGIPGELFIGGAGVARGYLNRPDLTAERFVPNPFGPDPGCRLFKSGDRVRWRTDGHLAFLGRTDRQVKLRGFRIELGEIEAVLVTQAGVAQAAVIAREDGPAETYLVAYVVPVAGTELDRAALRHELAARLPDYMIPAAFVELDSLPLNASGKVDRRALRAPERLGETYRAPRTTQEQILCELFGEVLAMERVGLDDSFFVLGGDSLSAIRLMNRVRSRFGFELALHTVFEAPTAAELAQRLHPGRAGVRR